MPWPNDDITLLGEQAFGAFSNGAVITFSPVRPGRLLVAFFADDPGGIGFRMPDEPGWSLGAYFSSFAPSYVWYKVADGTETSVTVSHGVMHWQDWLAVLSISASVSTLEGPEDSIGPTLDTMTVASAPVNTRLDFVLGDDAPASWPSTDPPAVLITGVGGASARRSSAIWATPLGSLDTGATVPGATYVGLTNDAVSFLLYVRRRGWHVGYVGG